MPLVDAYIKCGKIEGSYKATKKSDAHARLEETHDGWSEIYSFDYTLADDYPTLSITKPLDNASNDLYVLYQRHRARDLSKGTSSAEEILENVTLEICRWVDTNDDGIIDESQVFLEYKLEQCRILDYSAKIDLEADDMPEEKVNIGFRKMTMNYYLANSQTPIGFTWDFMSAKKIGNGS